MDWNEWEDLEPTLETVKSVTREIRTPSSGEQAIQQAVRARVRAQTPDWKPIADASQFLTSGSHIWNHRAILCGPADV